jgi:hypothetical protein
MGRDMKDIRGRALKRTSKSAVGRALFKAKGGTIKKQVGGLAAPVGGATPPVGGATPPVGGAPLGARHPGATGSMGQGPYSGAATMAKHGGTIKKKKK